jgi:hypothetical protein
MKLIHMKLGMGVKLGAGYGDIGTVYEIGVDGKSCVVKYHTKKRKPSLTYYVVYPEEDIANLVDCSGKAIIADLREVAGNSFDDIDDTFEMLGIAPGSIQNHIKKNNLCGESNYCSPEVFICKLQKDHKENHKGVSATGRESEWNERGERILPKEEETWLAASFIMKCKILIDVIRSAVK